MADGHFIATCVHGVVVSQCRCPAPNKTVRRAPCPPTCETGEGITVALRCPRCDSPRPNLHPAMQFEGEVQVCLHPWHEAAG